MQDKASVFRGDDLIIVHPQRWAGHGLDPQRCGSQVEGRGS